MHYGTTISTGDYYLFFGAGDLLVNSSTIDSMMSLTASYDYIMCDVKVQGSMRILPHSKYQRYKKYMHIFCNHQGTIISASLYNLYPFDLKLKIASDYNQFLYIHKNFSRTICYLDRVTAFVEANGTSNLNIIRTLSEQISVFNHHYPELSINYFLIYLRAFMHLARSSGISRSLISKYRYVKFLSKSLLSS